MALISTKARKRFGQNFLIDQGIIRLILRAVSAKPEERVVEIGPGHGALTEGLVEQCPQLQVIELDRDLITMLNVRFDMHPEFAVHNMDALKVDFLTLIKQPEQKLRVVGNLPYNISTPLIFHLLSFKQNIQDMHFMLQKEVVSRLAASADEKAYGRLSVMTQYYCQVEHLFDVPPESFRPAPKVDSAIVRLTPHETTPYPVDDYTFFDALVKASFQQRRKTLRNSLKQFFDTHAINEQSFPDLPVSLGQRAEQLSLLDYTKLANYLTRTIKEK